MTRFKLRLSIKTWKRVGFLSFLALLAGLYLLGAACNGYLAVADQKALPCRLVASVSQMDAALLMQVEKIEGVTGVTEVLEVPGTFQVGKEARAEFTLYGLSPDFLEERFTKGGAFPESSVMPYVVLNGAAAASATDAEGRSLGKDQQPDWFQENVEILAGEKAVRVKICGQMQGEEGETPAGYISLSAAKDLLRESGVQPESQTLWIRLENMGRMESVQKELERQGIFAANADETAGIAWEQQEKESAAYLAAGMLALLSGSVLLGRQLALEPLQHAGEWKLLRTLGCSGKQIAGIGRWRAALASAAALALALAGLLCVPLFLGPEAADSLFALTLRGETAGICLLAMLLCFPGWFVHPERRMARL